MKRICTEPDCGNTYEHRASMGRSHGYCDECKRNGKAATHRSTRQHRNYIRNDARQKIYNSKRWKTVRRLVRNRDLVCQLCGATELERPLVVDHYPIPILECTDPYDETNCRLLCVMCSGREDGKRGSKHHRGVSNTLK